MGAWEDGFAAGYANAMQRMGGLTSASPRHAQIGSIRAKAAKPKRRASAYSKRYGAAFKRLQKQYKTKSGSWRKGGFKACQKAAHKAARK